MFKTQFIFLILIIFLSACSSERPQGESPAEVLFKEAQELLADEQYTLATLKLNELKNKYPYSYYATPSELLQADILFSQEEYIEAAAAYMLFRDLHPKHAKLDYVVYRIAESYYNQIPSTFDRDLTPAKEAIKYYRELLLKYVHSNYTKDANNRINECEQMLRNKEQYIADFYYKTDVFDAAAWRYNYILKNFKQKELREHAAYRVISSSFNAEQFSKCLEYIDIYIDDLNSEAIKKVRDIRKDCEQGLLKEKQEANS